MIRFEYAVTYRGKDTGERLVFDHEPTDDELYEALNDRGLLPSYALREHVAFPADEHGRIRVENEAGVTYYTLVSA